MILYSYMIAINFVFQVLLGSSTIQQFEGLAKDQAADVV